MHSVTKSKVFATNLLAIIFSLLVAPIATALDTPDLTWERGRQQAITLGGNTSSQLWQIKLSGNNQELKFEQSSKNKDGFIVYTVEIPEQLPVGRYQVKVTSLSATPTVVAYVNISPTISYDPLADPKKVGVIAVIAFTLLTFFTGNRSESQSDGQQDDAESEESQSALGSVDTAYMGVGTSRRGKGDQLGIGRSKFIQQLDLLRHITLSNTAARSPLLMRVLADSTYLQSIAGALVVILPVIGGTLGVVLALQTDFKTSLMPTAITLCLSILLLALLDSLSGLIAFVAYFLVALLTGYITSFADIQGLLGLSLLWFTPALAAVQLDRCADQQLIGIYGSALPMF